MSIVVIGATGHLGRLVIEDLLARVPADQLVAVARDPGKAVDLAERGVTVRIADYDHPETLEGVFGTGDVVLLISAPVLGQRVPQHAAVIKAATVAGVARLAYTGVLGGPAADFALADEHKATERLILDSGLPYTFLRNGWYVENYTGQIPVQLAHGLAGSAGEGRVGAAPRADFAAAAAAVLVGDGHENRAYELSGDHAFTLAEYAAELSRQSGTAVAYADLPSEAFQGILVGAGVPEPVAKVLVDADVSGIGGGLLAGGSGDLARLIGRPTTPLAESIAAALTN